MTQVHIRHSIATLLFAVMASGCTSSRAPGPGPYWGGDGTGVPISFTYTLDSSVFDQAEQRPSMQPGRVWPWTGWKLRWEQRKRSADATANSGIGGGGGCNRHCHWDLPRIPLGSSKDAEVALIVVAGVVVVVLIGVATVEVADHLRCTTTHDLQRLDAPMTGWLKADRDSPDQVHLIAYDVIDRAPVFRHRIDPGPNRFQYRLRPGRRLSLGLMLSGPSEAWIPLPGYQVPAEPPANVVSLCPVENGR